MVSSKFFWAASDCNNREAVRLVGWSGVSPKFSADRISAGGNQNCPGKRWSRVLEKKSFDHQVYLQVWTPVATLWMTSLDCPRAVRARDTLPLHHHRATQQPQCSPVFIDREHALYVSLVHFEVFRPLRQCGPGGKAKVSGPNRWHVGTSCSLRCWSGLLTELIACRQPSVHVGSGVPLIGDGKVRSSGVSTPSLPRSKWEKTEMQDKIQT